MRLRVATAMRQGPGQNARLGLAEPPADGLFCAVVPSAQRRQITLTGISAPVIGPGVIEIAARRRPAATREGAAPIADADQVGEQARGPVPGHPPRVRAGPRFQDAEPQ